MLPNAPHRATGRLSLPPRGAPPRPIHGDPSGWRRHSILREAASPPQRVPVGQGAWARTGHPYWCGALRTSQASAQEARREAGPTLSRPAEPSGYLSPGPPSRLSPHRQRGCRPPTCPSAAAGSWWPPASYVDAPPEPHTGPARAPPPPPPPLPSPPPPTHWAGPRPPGPFKSGPYHRARRGRPGRAERLGTWPGAAPFRGQREAQRAAQAP